MPLGTRTLVGRTRELHALTHAIEQAVRGSGGVVLVSGEPGIGKSRFVEEVARIAAEHELNVLWGRAWEAGGAPAYWLFIQVLRSLMRMGEPRALLSPYAAGVLSELLPELRERSASTERISTLDPEPAHFRLLDTTVSVLIEAAQRAPLLVVLEDLHAADPASIALLSLLAQQAPQHALIVLGTYREADAQRGELGSALTRLARSAERIALPRLDREQVQGLLAQLLSTEPEPSLCQAVFEATEGNPLFVSELSRLSSQARGGATLSIPPSIRAAIRARLGALTPAARALLGLAAVVGREVPSAVIERIAARADPALTATLQELITAEIVLEAGPGLLRFSHILLREVAYSDLNPHERSALHLQYAHSLEQQPFASWSERAHHLARAGEEAWPAALQACRAAADAASMQHAHAEAARWHAEAVRIHGLFSSDAGERGALVQALGEAHMLAHDFAAGRAACQAAMQLAHTLGDAELLARAALSSGAVFRIGEVDQQLVAALGEALERLPALDSPLRAAVMARLAAALQPASDPLPPIHLALEAVDMARRVCAPQELLAVIRSACSAIIDLARPDDAEALCQEHIALAEKLHNDAEVFRANVRLSICAYSAGHVAEALHAIEECERLGEQLNHPQYRWRAFAVSAMRALWEGRFQEASELRASALACAEESNDPSAAFALTMQELTQLALQGRYDELPATLPHIERLAPRTPVLALSTAVWRAAMELRGGQRRDAFARVARVRDQLPLLLPDRTLLSALVDVAIALDDRALITELKERAAEQIDENGSSGVLGMTWDAPTRQALAELEQALGNIEGAMRHYDAVFNTLRKLGGRAHLFRALLDHGRACLEHSQRARGERLLDEARVLGLELGIADQVLGTTPSAAASSAQATASPLAPSAGAAVPKLVREGDHWLVEHGEHAFRLRDGKGIAMLARLLQEPGRELHVLDLVASTGTSAPPIPVDGGDSGALLDARARREYEARVQDLRRELDEAEQHHDLGRAERAKQELDALARELSRAVGLGGRARRAGSAVERARVNVQRRLRDAIERIREHDAELGRHLAFTVRTGTYCSYLRS